MMRLVALVPDLMDRSRIEAAARAAGRPITFVSQASDLLSLGVGPGDLVIVDLAIPDVLDVLPALAGSRTIGFGSHVDHELLEGARAAGCGEVLPRSALFHRLPRLLSEADQA